jgi:RNA polymerase sigma-70 factor (ECF subfamily)
MEATWYGSSVARVEEEGGSSLGRQALAHADTLFNFACYLTGNDSEAEDLVQETFARALGAAAHFDGRNLKAWLFKILRNAFIDVQRKRKLHPIRGGLDTTEPNVEGPVETDLLRDDIEIHQLRNVVAADIEAAILSLTPDARAVILLDLEGLTEVEVADVLGCPVGTVKSRLSRARSSLRRRLKDYAR